MLYMQSTCTSDGRYTLTITFKVGTDLNFAQVLVQNRVSAALAQLPQAVQQQGVVTKKKSTGHPANHHSHLARCQTTTPCF